MSTMRAIEKKKIDEFIEYLIEEEKTEATLKKYAYDVKSFSDWCGERALDRKLVLEYKEYLGSIYAPASINSILSSLNAFFNFCRLYNLKVKALKIQRQLFMSKEKELSKQEYEKLLRAAKSKGNERLYLVMQTICASGIRVSELKCITAEAVKSGRATIRLKGKTRVVILSRQLCKILSNYMKRKDIRSGPIFVTKGGKPLDRSNIWSDMKKLCESAGVDRAKVFPHNLRHLFARSYYSAQKDIVRLADILGHSSVDTTRIYTMETGEVHRRQIEALGLLRC